MRPRTAVDSDPYTSRFRAIPAVRQSIQGSRWKPTVDLQTQKYPHNPHTDRGFARENVLLYWTRYSGFQSLFQAV